MKYIDQGDVFSVKVSLQELEDFAESWPCFGEATSPLTFQFDRHTGDLIGMEGDDSNITGEAVSAICDDAREFGMRQPRSPKRIFQTFKLDTTLFLSIPDHGYALIVSDVGDCYGSWASVARFKAAYKRKRPPVVGAVSLRLQ